jgi:probable HAF family extracellular repeat protein
LKGAVSLSAQAINNSGHVAGYSYLANTFHAYLYADGRTKDLDTITTTTYSIAYALNAQDEVVGTATDSGVDQAFLYEFGHMVYLTGFLPKDSGWTLYTAYGINDAGQIVGGGQHNGMSRPFLMTPVR